MRRLLAAAMMALALGAAPAPAAETGLDWLSERFMDLDINGDGGVSWREFMKMVERRAQKRFAEMDRNGDGIVSEREFRAFWKARKARYYRLMH